MNVEIVVGGLLLAGLVLFLIGAGAWRLEYDAPLVDALRAIQPDRRRRAWIHLWMILAMLVTPAGLGGFPTLTTDPSARALATAGAVVYALGAVCWIVSLVFRLSVVPWAADRTVTDGTPPEVFVALDGWAGGLYGVHLLSAYATFGVLGVAVLVEGVLPAWLGWLGVVWGPAYALGFISRWSGVFQPPAWAHLYTGLLGIMLLRG
jgi:hypothetical protein